MSWFFILCRHERESAKNTKRLLEQRRVISKANSMALVSAVKIDEWFGNLLLLICDARTAAAPAASPIF